MITEIINNFVNVRNKIKDVNGKWVDLREKDEFIYTANNYDVSLPSNNGVLTIFNRFDVKIILESFVYNTTTRVNSNGVYPSLITIRNGNPSSIGYNLFHLVSTSEEYNRTQPLPTMIEQGHSEYLEIVVKDDEHRNDQDDPRVHRIISLKKPIVLPKGGILSIVNPSNVTQNVTYKVIYRVLEV